MEKGYDKIMVSEAETVSDHHSKLPTYPSPKWGRGRCTVSQKRIKFIYP